MRNTILNVAMTLSTFAFPMLASAQGATRVTASPQDGIIGLIVFANTALNDIMVLLITAAIVAFFWGMVRYLMSGANGETRAEGLKTIMYSLIAIFVMVSIWGVIHLLQNTFGVSGTDQAERPSQIQLGTQSGGAAGRNGN
jgi:hypothetical protein